MAALKYASLQDHLCWVWRLGGDSADEALAEAALLAEQVLRVLGVEHDSLDHMLCQVCSNPLPCDCIPRLSILLKPVIGIIEPRHDSMPCIWQAPMPLWAQTWC